MHKWPHIAAQSSFTNSWNQPEAVVVEFVIRSHRDETPPSTTQRVEDLRCCVSPHLQQDIKKKDGINSHSHCGSGFPCVWVPLRQGPSPTVASDST